MNQYVNARGWWVTTVRKDWKADVKDGPDTPIGTILGTVICGEWEPVAMWKVNGDDHTTAVPLVVEDGNKMVEMGTHFSDYREFFYTLEYSADGMPPRIETRNIVKE